MSITIKAQEVQFAFPGGKEDMVNTAGFSGTVLCK